jgi:hypothetical protein
MPSRLLCRYSWYRIRSCMSFTCETIPSRWQCQYGPTDRSNAVRRVSADMVPLPKKYNQKGKRITSGQGQKGPRTTDAQEGGSIKRGCQCMFYVKRYYFLPDIAEISYITVKHVSREGIVVHDKTTLRDKTSYAKHISEEIKDFVRNLYLAGVPIARIHCLHMATIIKLRDEGNLVKTKDCFLSEDDVCNVCGLLQKDLYMKDPNDAESVRMWVHENPDLVFYYQDPGGMVDGAIMADNMPFVIGIQTNFQFRMMLQYGHQSAIAIDATFATNDKKVGLTFRIPDCKQKCRGLLVVLNRRVASSQFPLFTMMVFDEWQNGVPIAFVITARQK